LRLRDGEYLTAPRRGRGAARRSATRRRHGATSHDGVLAERDRLGNSAAAGLPVRRLTLPVVAITSPADLSLIAATTVTGTGAVSDPTATARIAPICMREGPREALRSGLSPP
jgi:hypothetical protein